jgi:hypothetical protein
MQPNESGSASGGGGSSAAPMLQMAREHYAAKRWVLAPIVVLAAWLMASPFTLGYRSTALAWSDVSSGIVVLGLAILALRPNRGLFAWSIALVGAWLVVAPLVFWAPDAVGYANDTLVGALLVAFALLVPMGMTMEGAAIPPGWSYNPSSWPQRAPIIALGLVGFLVARHMAAYQLGYIDRVWDPFFGAGTVRVLDSEVSRAWPISDAGLGAATYLAEVLMGFMGDQRRWRTMPWMVAVFGVVVVPLGVVSITLVIMQPLVVGQWCSACLFTAAAMLLMIPLALDEVVAMVQFVVRRKRQGASAWRVFWLGDHLEEGDAPVAAPARADSWRVRGMMWGVTNNWTLWLVTAIGLWLMFAPTVFGIGIENPAADTDHLVGALLIVVSVIALAEVARPIRFLNFALAGWLIAATWITPGVTTAVRVSDIVAGVLVLLLSLPLGRVRDHYGAFDRVVAWNPLTVLRLRRSSGGAGRRATAH